MLFRSRERRSSAATVRAAAGVLRALRPRIENREYAGVRRMGELGDGVGADLVRLVAREQMSLFVDERLGRPKVYGAMSLEDATGSLLELPAAHRDREERIAFDVLPIRLLQQFDPVEAGALQRCDELLFGQRAGEALAPQLLIHLDVRRSEERR